MDQSEEMSYLRCMDTKCENCIVKDICDDVNVLPESTKQPQADKESPVATTRDLPKPNQNLITPPATSSTLPHVSVPSIASATSSNGTYKAEPKSYTQTFAKGFAKGATYYPAYKQKGALIIERIVLTKTGIKADRLHQRELKLDGLVHNAKAKAPTPTAKAPIRDDDFWEDTAEFGMKATASRPPAFTPTPKDTPAVQEPKPREEESTDGAEQ